MASHYTRERSPFYWIRYRTADGVWSARSSGVRIDATGALRIIKKMVASESAKEACERADGSAALFLRWVPAWMNHRYENIRTLARQKITWTHISGFFDTIKVKHPAEVTYGMVHEYVRWRVGAGVVGTQRCLKPARWAASSRRRCRGVGSSQTRRPDWVWASATPKRRR